MQIILAMIWGLVVLLLGYKLGGATGFQISGSLVTLTTLAGIAVWNGAKTGRGPLVFVRRNWIVIIESGDQPTTVLANLGNKYQALGMKIVDASTSTHNPLHDLEWWEQYLAGFGLYWKGFAPAKVKVFPFVHERKNPQLNADTPSKNWIIVDPEPVPTNHLLFDAPHWFKVSGVEFSCGFRADIMIETQSRCFDPIKAVYDREGKFFPILDSLVNSAVINICRTMTYKQFMAADTDATSNFSEKMIAAINPPLLELAGLELYTFFVYRYDAATTEETLLAREKATAKIRLEVAKLNAQGDVADVTEAIKAVRAGLKGQNVDPNLIVQMIGDVAVAERIRKSNLMAVGATGIVDLTGRNNNRGPKPQKGKKP